MERNKVAQTIQILGYIMIGVGVLGSLGVGAQFSIMGNYGTHYMFSAETFNWLAAGKWAFFNIIPGVVFIALAEIIELLDKSHKHQKELEAIILLSKEYK